MRRLLVIDDRPQTIELCHKHLPHFEYVTRCDRKIPCQVCEERTRGCALKHAHDYFEAKQALEQHAELPDLIVLDLHFALPEERLLPVDKAQLPTGDERRAAVDKLRRRQGLLILEQLRAEYPTVPVVLLTTTHGELPSELQRDRFVYFCENELVDSRSLAAEITRVLGLRQEDRDERIVFGPAAQELRRTIDLLARSPLPLLLEGETGTGKSFLSEHYLHPRSGRKGPLVVTDLSTIPPSLLPAHLFGARRGAYTGAVEDHPGVFEQAHGGTLFLDEIANLDLDNQRQLLLVLERSTVTRLGDTRARPIDCKVIAATNQDLQALCQAGRFRADLLMRLNPATRLRLPPLRELRADLPLLLERSLLAALGSDTVQPLVSAFLSRFPTPDSFVATDNRVHFGRVSVERASRSAFSIFLSERARDRLCRYGWPGNHRELRLVATNLVVETLLEQLDAPPQTSGRAPAILQIRDRAVDKLLQPDATVGARSDAGAATIPVAIEPQRTFAAVSRTVEIQYMRALYARHRGDLDQMAKQLLGPRGSARQVHLRLNQLGLSVRELRSETSGA